MAVVRRLLSQDNWHSVNHTKQVLQFAAEPEGGELTNVKSDAAEKDKILDAGHSNNEKKKNY